MPRECEKPTVSQPRLLRGSWKGMAVNFQKIKSSPALIRAIPFVLFVLLTAAQGYTGRSGPYYLYVLKTALGAWMILVMRPLVSEMRWSFSLAAVLAGVGVFVMWVGLADFLRWLHINPSFAFFKNSGPAWNPRADFGHRSGAAWFF